MQIQWSLSSWSGLCERWNNNIHLWRCLGPFTCIMKKSGLLQHHCNRSYVAVEEGVVGFSSTFHKSSNFLPPVKLSAQVKHGLQGTHTLVLRSASILLIIHWNTHFTPQRKYLYVQQLITLSKRVWRCAHQTSESLRFELSKRICELKEAKERIWGCRKCSGAWTE